MGISIEELTNHYQSTNERWTVEGLLTWLERKGVPTDIAHEVLKQVLMEYTTSTLPATTHEFDHLTLKLAQGVGEKIKKAQIAALEQNAMDTLKKYDSDWYSKGKLRKIWEVIMNRD